MAANPVVEFESARRFTQEDLTRLQQDRTREDPLKNSNAPGGVMKLGSLLLQQKKKFLAVSGTQGFRVGSMPNKQRKKVSLEHAYSQNLMIKNFA